MTDEARTEPSVPADDSDDDLELSASTLSALTEFLSEQKEKEAKLKQIEEGNVPESFDENWVSYFTISCL